VSIEQFLWPPHRVTRPGNLLGSSAGAEEEAEGRRGLLFLKSRERGVLNLTQG